MLKQVIQLMNSHSQTLKCALKVVVTFLLGQSSVQHQVKHFKSVHISADFPEGLTRVYLPTSKCEHILASCACVRLQKLKPRQVFGSYF